MKTDIISGITRLTADEGKRLTNGKGNAKVVWLSPQDSAGKWTEIVPMDAQTELPLVKAELDGYKLAVAEVTAMEPIIEQTIEQMEGLL